jgi:hypothetical protein
MKPGYLSWLLLSVIAIHTASYAQNSDTVSIQEDDTPLTGPYLGQTPPGLTPEPFAPGIVNTTEWGDAGGFSLDMNEFYVTRWRHTRDAKEPEFATFKRVGNRWHKSVIKGRFDRPFHAPDGKTLHYDSKYKERTENGWSELKSLGPAFEEIQIMGLTSSATGTLVLDERGGPEGDGILRYSRLINGKHEDPKPFGKAINTGTWNAHPFIAPDETYIMWDGERTGGYGDNDIYISFRQSDGSWGEAINLGDTINTASEEGGPKVTPDGKYLFFNRMVPRAPGDPNLQSDLYWVDAQIIEDLRPKE